MAVETTPRFDLEGKIVRGNARHRPGLCARLRGHRR
jgi:hypothetical protein